MMRNVTVDMLIQKANLFHSCEAFDSKKTMKVELVDKVPPPRGIPRLHFAWNQEHHFYNISKEHAVRLLSVGFTVEERKAVNGDDKSYSVFVMEKFTSHLWFMNFRRYGWCSTEEMEGEYGYSGDVYANGPVFQWEAGELATPENKIRDSLVRSWTKLVEGKKLPKEFDCYEVHQAIGTLLKDAIANQSEHARIYPSPVKDPEYNVPVVEITS